MTSTNETANLASDQRERRAKQAAIGKQLRDAYGTQSSNEVPADFEDLLKRIDERSKRCSEKNP
ncbi:MAG: NepR family anti-sigma factor [Pseudomonadota bacterium]